MPTKIRFECVLNDLELVEVKEAVVAFTDGAVQYEEVNAYDVLSMILSGEFDSSEIRITKDVMY